MELKLGDDRRELKFHGTYGFPVNVGRKRLSVYETGSFPWHWHDEIELTLILEGEMEYRINDACYVLSAGEGLFCNMGALHTGAMREGRDCDYVSLTFHPRFLWGFEGSVIRTRYMEGILESQSLSSLKLSPEEPWQRKMLENLRRAYELFFQKEELYELEVQRLLLELWAELYRHCGEEAKKAPVEDVERIERQRALLAYLHRHYGEKITLDDLARQVNLSKSECCRFFKRQMGQSLFDYLLDYRVGKSMELLREGHSVAETAELTGFGGGAYFSKVFRERTGRSPSQYRREREKQ